MLQIILMLLLVQQDEKGEIVVREAGFLCALAHSGGGTIIEKNIDEGWKIVIPKKGNYLVEYGEVALKVSVKRIPKEVIFPEVKEGETIHVVSGKK